MSDGSLACGLKYWGKLLRDGSLACGQKYSGKDMSDGSLSCGQKYSGKLLTRVLSEHWHDAMTDRFRTCQANALSSDHSSRVLLATQYPLSCSDSLTGPKKNPELSKRVGEHVKVNVNIFMEADQPKHGTVSWAQFLREQSIYILAARRNAANLYKIAPKPEELEIIDRNRPIRTLYLGHVTGYQPIRDQNFLIRSVPDTVISHYPPLQAELVACLSPLEVSEAKQFFKSFDADADGKITLREAEKAYERWFASLWSKVLGCSDSLTGPKKNPELSKRVGEHVKVNVNIFMEADQPKHGTVSWAQFLREQSIYILAARRNAANLYKIAPKPEELEIIESETNFERLLEPSSEGG
eukprot:sb/3466146/